MNTPKKQLEYESDSGTFRFTEAHDPVEVISRPFPFDFLALIGLILLSPLVSRPYEASMYQRAVELQALVYALPYLTVMALLGLSIARNRQRSPAVRFIAGVIAVPAFVIACLWFAS